MPWIIAAAAIGSAAIGSMSANSAAGQQADSARAANAMTMDMFNTTRGDLSPWRTSGGQANDMLSYYMGLGGSGAGTMPTQQQFTSNVPSGGLTAAYRAGGDQGAGGDIGWQPAHQAMGTQFNQGGYDQAMAAWQQQQGARNNDPRFGSLLRPFSLADFQQSPAYQFNLQQGQMAIDQGANARGNLYAPQTLQDLGKYQQGLASNEFQNAFSNYNTNQGNIYARLFGMSGSGQNAANLTGRLGAEAASQMGTNTVGAGNATAAGTMGVNNAMQGGINNLAYAYMQNQAKQNQQSIYASD